MSVRTLLAVSLAALVLAGCSAQIGGGSTSNADPGGKRLAQLRADAVFASKPSGASAEPVVASVATRRPAGLDGGGDDAPSVTVALSSAAPPRSVFEFYDQLATSHGWTAIGSNSAGRPNQWRKRYPSGLQAALLLLDLDQRQTGAGAQHRYQLICGTDTTN